MLTAPARVPPLGRRRTDAVTTPVPDRSLLQFGRERFRFTLHREQRRLSTLNIDPFVESCNWSRDTGVRTGNLNFQRPLTGQQAGAIADGDRVRCDVDALGDGRWVRLWQMTVSSPSHAVAAGTIAVALKSGLKAAQASKSSWRYRGMNARQITLAVCKRFDLPVGRLPQATHRIEKLVERSMSPYDVIVKAWRAERMTTGRRFDVDISRGAVDVSELRAPTYMLELGPAILDATLESTLTMMTSAVVVTSSRRVGGRRRKIRVRVVDADRVRRYGYIVKTVNRPNLHSEAAARKYGREWLARAARPSSSVQFSHPGLPFLDRGDALTLVLPQADLRQLVYVTGTSHALSAGSYVMDVTVATSDPFAADARQARVEKKKADAARRRRRARASAAKAPRPAKASRRSGT